MQAYIQAAEQLKEDIAEEYIRANPHVARENILNDCPSGKLVFDNIEIVFKNSAKYKIFSQRVRGEKRSILEGDDLLYAYLTTSNDDSYNDSLESAKCCKKLSYFLFTSRFEKYTLVERNKYADRLHKHENRLPSTAIDLYNAKKSLMDLMFETKINPTAIQPLTIKYVTLLNHLLESQASIYQIEYKLAGLFQNYLEDILMPQFSLPGFKIEPVKLKALVQALKELHDRGLEFEEIKDKISLQTFQTILSVLSEHRECLVAEIRTIADVNFFLTEVIKYADPPKELAEKQEDVNSPNFIAAIRDRITSSFAEWLSS